MYKYEVETALVIIKVNRYNNIDPKLKNIVIGLWSYEIIKIFKFTIITTTPKTIYPAAQKSKALPSSSVKLSFIE